MTDELTVRTIFHCNIGSRLVNPTKTTFTSTTVSDMILDSVRPLLSALSEDVTEAISSQEPHDKML